MASSAGDLETWSVKKREIPPHEVRVNISSLPVPLSGLFFAGSERLCYAWTIWIRPLHLAHEIFPARANPFFRGKFFNCMIPRWHFIAPGPSQIQGIFGLTTTPRLNSPASSGKFTFSFFDFWHVFKHSPPLNRGKFSWRHCRSYQNKQKIEKLNPSFQSHNYK